MQTIKGDVGCSAHRDCRNDIGDQLAVVTLLNRIPEHFGGTGGKLRLKFVEGFCPDELYEAIVRFQETNIVAIAADGRVEPGGITLHFLNRLAARSLPIQKFNHYTIDSFVEDLYEETLAEAYRDCGEGKPPQVQSLCARP